MMAIPASEPAPTPARLPWYTIDPRTLTSGRFLYAVLIALLLCSLSIAPLWRLLWYWPVYSARNFTRVTNSQGRRVSAWRWVTGREIRVYALPSVRASTAGEAADGARELLADAGLAFTVTVQEMPAPVLAAYQASLVQAKLNGKRQTCLDFERLQARLVSLRHGDPHADMLIVNVPIRECWWAHGMATFNSGLAVLEEDEMRHHLGKHETGHLVGYQYHDEFPLFVLGYPWEGLPWSRDTLMMLYGESNTLSPRSRDALRSFWRGMERRLDQRFLVRD